jgi:glycosyltransferase involved in cell wall biosynthesis
VPFPHDEGGTSLSDGNGIAAQLEQQPLNQVAVFGLKTNGSRSPTLMIRQQRNRELIVAFDTFMLANKFRNVGIYEYALNVLRQFHGITLEDRSISVKYFVSPGYSDDIENGDSHPGCEPALTSLLGHDRLWRLGLVTAACLRAGADVIFAPCVSILPLGVVPVVVTIHDVMPKKLPPSMVEKSTALKAATWVSAKMSRRVITDSEHSKKDIVELYNLPPEKVSVVYLGYNQHIFNSSPPDLSTREALLTRLGIRGPYIFHHGMVQARKNLGRLVEAYKLLQGRRNLGFQLVLAGAFGLGSKQVLEAARGQMADGNIVFTGTLEAGELAILMKGAALCVIPSLYEGFCLPMVEAMACGVPTIAANNTCMPEVSGGGLRYFDPLSEEDMAAAMENVLDHSDLQRELATHGLKRASEFSWRRCARETLSVLASANARSTVSAR